MLISSFIGSLSIFRWISGLVHSL